MINKECKNCGIEFTEGIQAKGFRALCKKCHSEYMKKYYESKPEKYEHHKNNLVKDNDLKYQEKTRALLMMRLSEGCIDCGETDAVVLEMDHRDIKTKKWNISKILKTKVSIEQFVAELDKCDVVCANCHRRRTARMFGSWRAGLA